MPIIPISKLNKVCLFPPLDQGRQNWEICILPSLVWLILIILGGHSNQRTCVGRYQTCDLKCQPHFFLLIHPRSWKNISFSWQLNGRVSNSTPLVSTPLLTWLTIKYVTLMNTMNQVNITTINHNSNKVLTLAKMTISLLIFQLAITTVCTRWFPSTRIQFAVFVDHISAPIVLIIMELLATNLTQHLSYQ